MRKRRSGRSCPRRARRTQGPGQASLILYHVSPVYFQTDAGDGSRDPGFSTECRLASQFTVGLLTDLQTRPIYYHLRDSIEAHLTIVFAALAVSRWIENQTGWSIRKFNKTARRPARRHRRRPSASRPPGGAEYLGGVGAFGVQGRVRVVFGDAPDAIALVPEG